MKKVLIVLLVLAVLLSLSSAALASRDSFRDSFKRMSPGGATILSDIDKTVKQKTEAKTRTGDAFADANNATNIVKTQSEAKALDCNSDASNTSAVGVGNTGSAASTSGPATAANVVNNSETDIIIDRASATADCDLIVVACDLCGCPRNAVASSGNFNGGNNSTCDKCDCCPATIKGDIDIEVKQETKAEAKTGDAVAIGNNALNVVDSCDKAVAVGGGTATNSSSVTIINSGTATSASGAAVSSNVVNNSVWIDILREATTTKTVNKFLQF